MSHEWHFTFLSSFFYNTMFCTCVRVSPLPIFGSNYLFIYLQPCAVPSTGVKFSIYVSMAMSICQGPGFFWITTVLLWDAYFFHRGPWHDFVRLRAASWWYGLIHTTFNCSNAVRAYYSCHKRAWLAYPDFFYFAARPFWKKLIFGSVVVLFTHFSRIFHTSGLDIAKISPYRKFDWQLSRVLKLHSSNEIVRQVTSKVKKNFI